MTIHEAKKEKGRDRNRVPSWAADGVSYPNVTKYLGLDESTFTVRLVDPLTGAHVETVQGCARYV